MIELRIALLLPVLILIQESDKSIHAIAEVLKGRIAVAVKYSEKRITVLLKKIQQARDAEINENSSRDITYSNGVPIFRTREIQEQAVDELEKRLAGDENYLRMLNDGEIIFWGALINPQRLGDFGRLPQQKTTVIQVINENS